MRAKLAKSDARACAPGDHARQPVRRGSEGDQCLARLRDGEAAAAPIEEDARFGGALAGAPPVPTTAIFSRTDGICAWQGCREQASATTESIEVESSHCGMGHHRGRRLRSHRSPGAEGRQLGAVRSRRLAQHDLSGSEPVTLVV